MYDPDSPTDYVAELRVRVQAHRELQTRRRAAEEQEKRREVEVRGLLAAQRQETLESIRVDLMGDGRNLTLSSDGKGPVQPRRISAPVPAWMQEEKRRMEESGFARGRQAAQSAAFELGIGAAVPQGAKRASRIPSTPADQATVEARATEIARQSGIAGPAARMMARMGYTPGAGLGPRGAGMRAALAHKKVGKRHGRIVEQQPAVPPAGSSLSAEHKSGAVSDGQ